jgi:hypothetical protein
MLLVMFGVGVSAALSYQTYLPIVYNPPLPTSSGTPPTQTQTPTPTATPTSIPAPVLFPNGDFEQGPVIWSQYSTNGWSLIATLFTPGVTAYDGTWAAWLGGSPEEISYIAQQILVPHGYPYMSYWYWIDSEDECGKDVGQVFVNGDLVDAYSLCYPNNTGGWVNRVVDLYAYTGNLVSITIMAACDESYFSNLFIDHVGFQPSLTIANHPPNDRIDIDASTLKQDVPGK